MRLILSAGIVIDHQADNAAADLLKGNKIKKAFRKGGSLTQSVEVSTEKAAEIAAAVYEYNYNNRPHHILIEAPGFPNFNR